MPRLYGFRERIDSTLYDAFSPRELWDGGASNPRLRMFGNKNVGQSILTNLQAGGRLVQDQTYVILTWYARTNVTDVCRFQAGAPYRGEPALPSMDLIRAWDAWAHATTADLVIGTRPMITRPLAELLGPRMFGSACGNPGPEMDDVGVLAEKMWKRHLQAQYAAAKGTRDERKYPAHPAFRDLPELEQEHWRAAAGVYPFTRPVIVPVRQNFSVHLSCDPSALTALLKIMPENIAPRPLVWVHLDGAMTRDVF